MRRRGCHAFLVAEPKPLGSELLNTKGDPTPMHGHLRFLNETKTRHSSNIFLFPCVPSHTL